MKLKKFLRLLQILQIKVLIKLKILNLLLVLKSKSGVIGIINNSRHSSYGYDQRIEIFGNKGVLISKNKKKYDFFIDRYKTAYKLQLKDLVLLAEKNKKPLATFTEGEKALLIANAAYKSLRTKKIIKIK